MSDPVLAETYAALRALMLAAAPGMTPAVDEPGHLSLDAPWPHPRKPNERLWFGGVRIGKRYVSYHLMPLYACKPLEAQVGERLSRRRQGKSCFNFRQIEPEAAADLERLTQAASKAFATPPKF